MSVIFYIEKFMNANTLGKWTVSIIMEYILEHQLYPGICKGHKCFAFVRNYREYWSGGEFDTLCICNNIWGKMAAMVTGSTNTTSAL